MNMNGKFTETVIKELDENKDIEIVSFDIYDTLLFRTVREPSDVFLYMFEKGRDLFPAHLSAEDWKVLRVQASKKANEIDLNGGWSEKAPTIDEIYKNIPEFIGNRDELIKLEIECEKLLSFCNEEIYELVKLIKNEYHKKLILVSDMYFDQNVLSDILSSVGIKMDFFDEFFVSCEYSNPKSSGELYNIVLDKLKISPNQMLHIGDQFQIDVGMAKKRGINALLYDFISEARYRHPFLSMENTLHNNFSCWEIYTHRLLAAQKCPYDGEKKDWYEMGAMIFGPFFSYATEWVLDFADKNKINVIRPLMREGDFLSKLLLNAAKYRNTSYDIAPLYISRFAVFTSSFSDISKENIHYILKTKGISVKQVFEVLNIKEYGTPYEEYYDLAVADAKNIVRSENNLWDDLFDYLTSSEMISAIREKNKDNKDNILKYIDQSKLNDRCITLDAGWRGFTQNTVDRLLNSDVINDKRFHLLLISKKGAAQNIVSGSNIRGYCGNYGKWGSVIEGVFTRIIELAMMSTIGTTIGYDQKGDEIVPRIKKIEYPGSQIENILCLQEGIEAFQSILLENKGTALVGNDREKRLFEIIERLVKYPTNKEAKMIGGLKYDLNFGVDSFVEIISKEHERLLESRGEELFFSRFVTNDLIWKEGLFGSVYADYHIKRIMLHGGSYNNLTLMYLVKEAISNCQSGKKIVIVGAGNNGKYMMTLFSLFNASDMVIGYVDNNEAWRDATIYGAEIHEVEHDYGDVLYLFSLLGKADIKMIKKQITDRFGREFDFVSY